MTGDGSSDEHLVARAVDGDEAAFEQLVVRYNGRARRLAFGFVRDAEAAEDVAQEAFLRAYRKLSTLGERASFRSWLFQIVANRARDELRRRKVRRESADLEEAERVESDDVPPDVRAYRSALSKRIRELIDELPEKSRTPLLMKETGEMTYAEIAEALGIPMGTAQIRIHRARLKIRSQLDELGLLPSAGGEE
ncbi:MAG: sigma-70 family RNA polymerase sigma factor [Acidobacteriota bacterium]